MSAGCGTDYIESLSILVKFPFRRSGDVKNSSGRGSSVAAAGSIIDFGDR